MKIKWYKGDPNEAGSYITVQEYVDNFERHRFISCAYWQTVKLEKESEDVIEKKVGYWQTKERTSYIIAWSPIKELNIEIPSNEELIKI